MLPQPSPLSGALRAALAALRRARSSSCDGGVARLLSSSSSGSSSSTSGSGSRFGNRALKRAAELDPKLLAKARRLALPVGAAAGVFGALVGAGGGVLINPLILTGCPAMPQRIISGTSLAAVATTGAVAGAVYASSGAVEPRSAALLAVAAVATAPFGARMTHKLDCARLRLVLAYWLFVAAPLVPLKAWFFSGRQQRQQQEQQTDEQPASSSSSSRIEAPPQQQQEQRHQPAILTTAAAAPAVAQSSSSGGGGDSSGAPPPLARTTTTTTTALLLERLAAPPRAVDAAVAAIGAAAGFASGLLGIGGGVLVTPLLAAALPDAPQQLVLGTSLAAMVLPSLVGLLQHARLGNVDARMGLILSAGTLAGAFVGSNCAVAAPPGVLESVFFFGMLFLGRRTLAAARRAVPPS